MSVLVVLVAGAAVVAVLLIVEDEPAVRSASPPTPEDVRAASTFTRNVKAAAQAEAGEAQTLVASAAELDSVVRLGARLLPGFRSELEVGTTDVHLRAAVPVPWIGQTRWINLTVTVPEFENGVDLDHVALGSMAVPPRLALELGRIGGNVLFGDGIGDTALGAASRMHIAGDTVTFDLAIAKMGTNGLMRGVFGALRGDAMPAQELIDAHYIRIREAMDRGDLPADGSFLPYIRFVLLAALDDGEADSLPNAYTAALFALTRICGAQEFSLLVGGLVESPLTADRTWQTNCSGPTLNGRIDSRRHFITAATIQALSNRGVAITVGEFKELRDTLQSGGFDFTDVAANNSGVRLSDIFMAAPAEEWPTLIARIDAEDDVIVPFDALPQMLTQAEFTAQFGSIESADYTAMLALIEAEIDAIGLHAPR